MKATCGCPHRTLLYSGLSRSHVKGYEQERRCRRRRVVVRAGDSNARQPWNINEFLRTVVFFNNPPSPGEILSRIVEEPLNVLKAMTGSAVEERKSGALKVIAPDVLSGATKSPQAEKIKGAIMVAGATGGLGRRVVKVLLEKGFNVRALIRDMEKAEKLLGSLPAARGASLELVSGDIAQRQTLLPENFQGIRGLIVCSSAIVTPKEGDTEDRKKYYQGIKYYDSEIMGDTPEMVDYKGVQNMLAKSQESLGLRFGKVILDASVSSEEMARWGSLDDVVMGGCSQSSIDIEKSVGEDGKDAVVFRGTVTSANSGGFASVRCKNFTPGLDLGAYEGIELRVKGNGQRFKMITRTDANWDGIGYTRSFDTVDGEWQTIKIPFDEFVPAFRAKTVKDGAKLDPSCVMSIQLMLSKFELDGELNPNFELGEFSLPITSIKGYMNSKPSPRVILVSSGRVTKLNRPEMDATEQKKLLKVNDMYGGMFAWKLKGEDEVRDSGVPFSIVRPGAQTEEPKGAPLTFDQGDNLLGKISREDVAELLVEMLGQTYTTDTTFEVISTVPFGETFVPEDNPEPRDWSLNFQNANLRQGVTGKTIDGVYTGK